MGTLDKAIGKIITIADEFDNNGIQTIIENLQDLKDEKFDEA